MNEKTASKIVPGISGIFDPKLSGPGHFEKLALEIFHFQLVNNPVYAEFCGLMLRSANRVNCLSDIPFLPVRFFRSHDVISFIPTGHEGVFTSSGTTGAETSRHIVRDASLYRSAFLNGFRHFYGSPERYRFFALLPGYLERPGSSLVYMMKGLMEASADREGGFFLNEWDALSEKLRASMAQGKNIFLLGVSFALADFAEKYPLDLSGHIVTETGGMKGRRKEIVREELHDILRRAFSVSHIHSEYGMSELMSQAWAEKEGRFFYPPWMKVMIRDMTDPLLPASADATGGINIIDLANVHSCSFIATDDLGKVHPDGSFEVLGRFDSAEARGCNLMYEG